MTPQVRPETPAPTIATRQEFVDPVTISSAGNATPPQEKGQSTSTRSICRSRRREKNIPHVADDDRPKVERRARCNLPLAIGNSFGCFPAEKLPATMA